LAQLISNRRDIDFVLYEQIGIEDLFKYEKYSGFSRKMFDMIISEARNLGIKEILPTYSEGDRRGINFQNGQVQVPQCFHRAYKLFLEGEWIAMAEDPEFGGQGLPQIIRQAAFEFILGANFSLATFGNLSHGTGKMIELFGSPKQKNLFLEKVYSGKWSGTMLLTEPGAGSDVGALTTSAVKKPDGTYSLCGNKIFITGGEHDLTENIIHPVLARIEGAPGGTRGISLFLVPKIWVHDDGTLGEPNDIVCTGIEEKMGLHASPTCSMSLGGKGKCRGLLLGEENRGMRVMFHMMNEARLDVGAQGFLHGSAAYLYALNYARERLQGRDLDNSILSDEAQVPIIRHPDIRRMLIQMKAYVEGMRSFIYYVAYCFDKKECAESQAELEHYDGFINLLTPVIKAYCSERGQDVCELAIQVFGGYGYTKEYPVEQLYRDCKITSIYEGTNGIQAMDLLQRKLNQKSGKIFSTYLQEIRKTVIEAKKMTTLERMANEVEFSVSRLESVAIHLNKMINSPHFKHAFAFAHPFLEVVGDVTLAWMHLSRALMASLKLKILKQKRSITSIIQSVNSNKEAAFYDGQLKSAQYFIGAILPITIGKINAIKNTNGAAIEINENSFGG